MTDTAPAPETTTEEPFIAPVAMEHDPDELFAGDRGVLDPEARRVLVRAAAAALPAGRSQPRRVDRADGSPPRDRVAAQRPVRAAGGRPRPRRRLQGAGALGRTRDPDPAPRRGVLASRDPRARAPAHRLPARERPPGSPRRASTSRTSSRPCSPTSPRPTAAPRAGRRRSARPSRGCARTGSSRRSPRGATASARSWRSCSRSERLRELRDWLADRSTRSAAIDLDDTADDTDGVDADSVTEAAR